MNTTTSRSYIFNALDREGNMQAMLNVLGLGGMREVPVVSFSIASDLHPREVRTDVVHTGMREIALFLYYECIRYDLNVKWFSFTETMRRQLILCFGSEMCNTAVASSSPVHAVLSHLLLGESVAVRLTLK